MRRLIVLLSCFAVAFATGFLVSCTDNSVAPACDPCPPQYTRPVTGWAVLYNLRLAYNRRDIAEIDAMLDTNFIFYLAPADVGGGLPEQWGRAEEILYTSRLFDPNYTGPNRCKSLVADLDIDHGVQWNAVSPDSFVTETWHRASVAYDFQIDIDPDTQFSPASGSQCDFTVRNIGTAANPDFRLVEWHDLGAPNRLVASPGTPPTPVQSSSWGKVKSLYR
jgi:hypothetical protein